MASRVFLLALLAAFALSDSDAQIPKCQNEESITFEKVAGYEIVSPSSPIFQVTQYRGSEPIAEHCILKCHKSEQCYSTVVESSSRCLGLSFNRTVTLKANNDVSAFIKTCSKVPPNCKKKLWTIERSPGYNLIASESLMRVMDNISYKDCLKRLFQSYDGKKPRSAQFVDYASKVDYKPEGNEIVMSVGMGSCILNGENKFTEPESYRVTNFDSFYVENQCVDDYPKKIERCSYEEYYNQTLKHIERSISNSSIMDCKHSCEYEEKFICRGFTLSQEIQGKGGMSALGSNQTCDLHSEDILTLGSWLLLKKPNAIYYRRVMCLNMSVECGQDSMTVRLFPRGAFRGRMYVSGRADKCGVPAAIKGPTTLTIPFNGDCGLNSAYSLGEKGQANRTLVYAMVVIQNNPIVQALGDRFIRVGCIVGGSNKYNLSATLELGTESTVDHGIADALGSPPPASALFNTSAVLPRVLMYVVDDPRDAALAAGQHPASSGAVALGEGLELRIEATPEKNDPIDIHAYHLVASSQMGDSSILLLDNTGCPTGQVDFPAFRRTVEDGKVRLAARFKAFRFPSSNVVKFNVMVQFCKNKCNEVICPRPFRNSRRSRSVNEMNDTSSDAVSEDFSVEVFDGAKVLQNSPHEPLDGEKRNSQIVIASSSQREMFSEMCRDMMGAPGKKVPLEVSFVVASGNTMTADSLVYGESKDKLFLAGVEDPFSNHNMICIHEVLFITISLVWLLIQVIILVGCLVVIRRYRNFAENQYRKDYHSFDNLGFDTFSTSRRVHWPDQNVDILHIN